MTDLSRRKFLKQAVVATGALVMTPAKKPRLHNEKLPQVSSPYDEATFIDAFVTQVKGNQISVRNGAFVAELFVSDRTRLWKGEVTSIEVVEPGDHVYALGLPREPLGFDALKIWVNIANLYGKVVEHRPGGFTLLVGPEGHSTMVNVVVTRRTLFNEVAGADFSALASGQPVQVVGVAQRDRVLVATRAVSYTHLTLPTKA